MKSLRYSIIFLSFIGLVSCNTEDPTPSFTPLDSFSVIINAPRNGGMLTPGELVQFEATVYGDTLNATWGLKAVWKSSVDGVLYEGKIGSDAKTSFETDSLTKNIHEIKLQIYNEIDSVLSTEVMVYNLIKLDTTERTDNSTTLKWCKVELNGVSGYELYRSRSNRDLFDEEPLYTTTDLNDTVYVDTTAQIGKESFYQVKLRFNDHSNVTSNLVSIRPGFFKDLDFPIRKILVDHDRNLVYALVTPKDSDKHFDSYGIAVFDGTDLNILNWILPYSLLVDMAISHDNNYMYVAETNAVHKVSLSDFSLIETIEVDRNTVNRGSFMRNRIRGIELGSNDRLYYHIDPPQYSTIDTEFRIIDLTTSTELPYSSNVSDAYDAYWRGDFTIDPASNNLYHVETTNPKIIRISTNSDTFSDQIRVRYVAGPGYSDHVIFSGDQVFWGPIIYNSNLEYMGRFTTPTDDNPRILDVSPDGNFAFGWGGLFVVPDQSHYKDVYALTDGAKFIGNRRLIIFDNDYSEPTSIIYRYSF